MNSEINHLIDFRLLLATVGSAEPETLHWARPRMPVAPHTETNILVHGMHGSALTDIFISKQRVYSDSIDNNLIRIVL